MVLKERKVPVERKMGAVNSFNSSTLDSTLVLYFQLIQTDSVLLLLPLSSLLGFPLYEDTANRRAATQQLYSFDIEIWFAPMLLLPVWKQDKMISSKEYAPLGDKALTLDD